MPPVPAPVKQADLTRYLRAAVKAGLPVSGLTIAPDGAVTLHVTPRIGGDDGPNPCDRLLR